jgi:nitric oxide reductase subunit B
MVLFVFNVVNCTQCQYSNKAVKLWALSTPIMAFLGAGVLGFLHTLAPINYYSHGTQITSAHSHLAFYSTYVMVVLMITSYAMPILRNHEIVNNGIGQKFAILAFWLMTASMFFMTLFIAIAGIMQVYIQRATTLVVPFIETQNHMVTFYWLREIGGLFFLIGLIIYIISMVIGSYESK